MEQTSKQSHQDADDADLDLCDPSLQHRLAYEGVEVRIFNAAGSSKKSSVVGNVVVSPLQKVNKPGKSDEKNTSDEGIKVRINNTAGGSKKSSVVGNVVVSPLQKVNKPGKSDEKNTSDEALPEYEEIDDDDFDVSWQSNRKSPDMDLEFPEIDDTGIDSDYSNDSSQYYSSTKDQDKANSDDNIDHDIPDKGMDNDNSNDGSAYSIASKQNDNEDSNDSNEYSRPSKQRENGDSKDSYEYGSSRYSKQTDNEDSNDSNEYKRDNEDSNDSNEYKRDNEDSNDSNEYKRDNEDSNDSNEYKRDNEDSNDSNEYKRDNEDSNDSNEYKRDNEDSNDSNEYNGSDKYWHYDSSDDGSGHFSPNRITLDSDNDDTNEGSGIISLNKDTDNDNSNGSNESTWSSKVESYVTDSTNNKDSASLPNQSSDRNRLSGPTASYVDKIKVEDDSGFGLHDDDADNGSSDRDSNGSGVDDDDDDVHDLNDYDDDLTGVDHKALCENDLKDSMHSGITRRRETEKLAEVQVKIELGHRARPLSIPPSGNFTNFDRTFDWTVYPPEVQVKIELGHTARPLAFPQPGEFTDFDRTYDWTVFVRGADEADISHYVEKVVFHLDRSSPDQSFQEPKLVCYMPPYQVSEQVSKEFMLPIDVFFKSKGEPWKVQFQYNLYPKLKQSSRYEKIILCYKPPYQVSEQVSREFMLPIDIFFKGKEEPRKVRFLYTLYPKLKRSSRYEKLTFNNPTMGFVAKLLQGGGILISQPKEPHLKDESQHPTQSQNKVGEASSPVAFKSVPQNVQMVVGGLNPGTASTQGSASHTAAVGHVANQQQQMLENVEKCRNFLSTLIRIAPKATVSSVRDLIQGLIDGKLEPELFTEQLKKELKSAAHQPHLAPFLKKYLPLLRQSLLSNKMIIDGVRPPPIEIVQQQMISSSQPSSIHQTEDVQVKLEYGHTAQPLANPAPDEFTEQDYTLFVRGSDDTDISHYVRKVVFYGRSKQVCDKPPFQVSEQGYGGFSVPIDVYFKRKKAAGLRLMYDLKFFKVGQSSSDFRSQLVNFRAPAFDFKIKLLQGGGILTKSKDTHRPPAHSSESKNKVNSAGAHVFTIEEENVRPHPYASPSTGRGKHSLKGKTKIKSSQNLLSARDEVQAASVSTDTHISKADKEGMDTNITSTDVDLTTTDTEPEVLVSPIQDPPPPMECEGCHTMRSHNCIVQCCEGHVICTSCVEKEAKLVIIGTKKGSVSCSVTFCNSSIPQSELRKSLPGMVVDLLEESWQKETLEALANMKDSVKCPGCGYQGVLETAIKNFKCNRCQKTYCRLCEMEWQKKKHDLCIKMTRKVSEVTGHTISIPAHWEIDEQNEEEMGFSAVDLDAISDEYLDISALFYKTIQMVGFAVKKVYRIQNQRLWEKYSLCRAHMIQDMGEAHINERRLFHGMNIDVINNICKEGFDWRVCGQNGTAFGQGTYFAKNASYSIKYSQRRSGKWTPLTRPSTGGITTTSAPSFPPAYTQSLRFNVLTGQPPKQPGSTQSGPQKLQPGAFGQPPKQPGQQTGSFVPGQQQNQPGPTATGQQPVPYYYVPPRTQSASSSSSSISSGIKYPVNNANAGYGLAFSSSSYNVNSGFNINKPSSNIDTTSISGANPSSNNNTGSSAQNTSSNKNSSSGPNVYSYGQPVNKVLLGSTKIDPGCFIFTGNSGSSSSTTPNVQGPSTTTNNNSNNNNPVTTTATTGPGISVPHSSGSSADPTIISLKGRKMVRAKTHFPPGPYKHGTMSPQEKRIREMIQEQAKQRQQLQEQFRQEQIALLNHFAAKKNKTSSASTSDPAQNAGQQGGINNQQTTHTSNMSNMDPQQTSTTAVTGGSTLASNSGAKANPASQVNNASLQSVNNALHQLYSSSKSYYSGATTVNHGAASTIPGVPNFNFGGTSQNPIAAPGSLGASNTNHGSTPAGFTTNSNLFVKHYPQGQPFTFGLSASSTGSDDDCLYMFVGRVLVGRMCKGNTAMRRPDKDPAGNMCHTAVDHFNSPGIFVVFDSGQCYPEYLIEISKPSHIGH